jgi:prepilin-type N-terminal cleavage/methylation domain-containing protein
MKKFKKKGGFTLIELLAVIGVFATIASLVTSILFITFRLLNKSNTLVAVKSNGNYALSQMVEAIRNARTMQSPFPCFTPPSNTSLTTSSISLVTLTNQVVTYSCDVSPVKTISSSSGWPVPGNTISLLDTGVNGSVVLNTCSFTCTQADPSDFPVITIDFSLNSNSAGNFTERQASASALPFHTSVVMRNLNR